MNLKYTPGLGDSGTSSLLPSKDFKPSESLQKILSASQLAAKPFPSAPQDATSTSSAQSQSLQASSDSRSQSSAQSSQDTQGQSNSQSAASSNQDPNPKDDGGKALDLSQLSNEAKSLVQQLAQNAQSLAQNPPKLQGKSELPGVVGTVQIRKQFKLFAREALIHNLSFRETPVREVIAEIARRGNMNILIDRSVVGRITGELRDVTLNEAMDSVLAAAGLQSRQLDGHTVIIATQQAMVQLGLNRPMARVFKLSYAHPYDVAMILHASVFNKGMIPDFLATQRRRLKNDNADLTSTESGRKAGGLEAQGATDESEKKSGKESDERTDESESSQTARPDQPRNVRGQTRSTVQEGVGFNNARTNPGEQQIRATNEISVDYLVEQNGGGAIVIPDAKNRQVLVVGTSEDIAIAEESIRLLDRRPKQIHIQASLVELSNQGIRQLGANVTAQGDGLSASVLGNSAAPLLSFLPGLGSPASSIANPAIPAIPFTGNSVTPAAPGTAFQGLLGALLPAPPTIAGVNALQTAATGFNFLSLGRKAGGRANIATVPQAINVSVNMLLQTNKAKLIANPSIVVSDNSEALIAIANQIVQRVTSTVSLGVVTTNVEIRDAGIFLNVLPRVTEDGFIVMRLRPQVSFPLGPPVNFGNANNPTIVTLLSIRDVLTQDLRVKDGQTLVVGGLFLEQEAAQLAKVPYLAETPVLGAFFRNSIKGRNRTELMLLLTPKIVEEEPPSQAITESRPPLQM